MPSTTGLAIYVLAKVRAGDDSSVIRDARKWSLLASQQSDGSWLTPAKRTSRSPPILNALKVRDELYHYWGTAWVTIGLLGNAWESQALEVTFSTLGEICNYVSIEANSMRSN